MQTRHFKDIFTIFLKCVDLHFYTKSKLLADIEPQELLGRLVFMKLSFECMWVFLCVECTMPFL